MKFTYKTIAWFLWFFVLGPVVAWIIYISISAIEPAGPVVTFASGIVPVGIYLGVMYLLEKHLAD